MRKLLVLVAALLCLTLPAWAGDDPFAAFRIPAHRTSSGQLGLTVGGYRTRYPGSAYDNARSLGRVDQAAGWDSDELQLDVQAVAIGTLDWTHNRSDLTYGWDDGKGQDRNIAGILSGSARSYPRSLPIGFEVAARLDGSDWDSWGNSNSQYDDGITLERTSSSVSYPRRSTAISVQGGVVYGRVRDAGVVYTVHVLEQRLRATGALTRELSPAAREKLAALFFVRPRFAGAHDQPDRWFARELERVLREEGAIAEGGLDAYATMRVLEGIQPVASVSRSIGASIGAYVRVEQRNQRLGRVERRTVSSYDSGGNLISYDESSSSYLQRTVDTQDWAGLSARYSRPLGWAWQFDLAATAEHPLKPTDPGLQLSLDAAARWRIAERWDAGMYASQRRLYLGAETWGRRRVADEWENDLGGDVGFYVEDHLRLAGGVTSYQARNVSYSFNRDLRYQMGLTYRFLGALDAPGALAPVRPVR